jgi:hypothetical protein
MGCLYWFLIVACAAIVIAMLYLVWAAIMMSTLAIGARIALFGVIVLLMVVYLVASIVDCKY